MEASSGDYDWRRRPIASAWAYWNREVFDPEWGWLKLMIVLTLLFGYPVYRMMWACYEAGFTCWEP